MNFSDHLAVSSFHVGRFNACWSSVTHSQSQYIFTHHEETSIQRPNRKYISIFLYTFIYQRSAARSLSYLALDPFEMLLDLGAGHAAAGHVQHGLESDVVEHGVGDGDAGSGLFRSRIPRRMPRDVAEQRTTGTHVLESRGVEG